jgi:hypothetical protein
MGVFLYEKTILKICQINIYKPVNSGYNYQCNKKILRRSSEMLVIKPVMSTTANENFIFTHSTSLEWFA